MNKQGIIKSVSTLFPTQWYSATKFGINQVMISIIMATFCGINRICKIAAFTGDGLVRVLLKLNKAINGNAISTALKKLGQNGARKLQSFLLSKNACWLKESGLTSITLDADSTVKSVCGNQEGAAKLKAIHSVKEYVKVEYLGEKYIMPIHQYSCYTSSYDMDAVQLHEIYKQRSLCETWIEQEKGRPWLELH